MVTGGWADPARLLQEELVTLAYQGVEVPGELRDRVMAVTPANEYDDAVVNVLWKELGALKPRADFPYVQPDELEEIRAARPKASFEMAPMPSEEELLDRFHGAWIGRCCGCALGKPVECQDGGWRWIKNCLQKHNDWPLKDYFSCAPAGDDATIRVCLDCCRENIKCMVGDDDVHYTLVGLTVMEEYGKDFQWQDIADVWDTHLPYNQICTAETQAILNWHLRKARCYVAPRDQNITAEFTRSHCNPYREWIGAQIRADFWAWAAAGDPERAAEYAWRDAHWTHCKNGIYGEMFVAALQAAAFRESDPHRLVRIGLSQIPENCRLAEEIRLTVKKCDELRDFDAYMEWHETHFAGMHAVHTVNNACIVAMALLLGNGDPDRSMCLAVSAGLDTDCNGATVGAILGILRGARDFGGRLAPQIHDTIEANMVGYQHESLTDLAKRTLAVWKKGQN